MADGYVHGRRDREEKEEFNEEEIWTAMNDKMEGIPKSTKAKDSSSSSSSSACSTTPTRQSMMIPKSNNGFFAESVGGRVPFQQSAPINIPDWSKIYKKKKKGRSSEPHHRDDNDDDDNDDDDNDDDDDDDDDEEEEEEEMIPPHEWIARKLARSQISPFSVFEGRGRTLKGRDLSKVRNAILTRTGFIE